MLHSLANIAGWIAERLYSYQYLRPQYGYNAGCIPDAYILADICGCTVISTIEPASFFYQWAVKMGT